MSTNLAFDELMRRVRACDEAAAAELVRSYQPAIRDAVRRKLVDARLQPLLDSMDISQSVLQSFFVRAAAGQYDLEKPEDLLKLLVRMARNKVIDQARNHRAERRDIRRVTAVNPDERGLVASDSSPSQKVAAQELFDEIRRRLSPKERQLAELRNQGCDWSTIAAQLGGTPQALRKKLARALDRIAQALGLEEAQSV
jgi:RNA polymerase sigma-70 factor (ECF subfamily)